MKYTSILTGSESNNSADEYFPEQPKDIGKQWSVNRPVDYLIQSGLTTDQLILETQWSVNRPVDHWKQWSVNRPVDIEYIYPKISNLTETDE